MCRASWHICSPDFNKSHMGKFFCEIWPKNIAVKELFFTCSQKKHTIFTKMKKDYQKSLKKCTMFLPEKLRKEAVGIGFGFVQEGLLVQKIQKSPGILCFLIKIV